MAEISCQMSKMHYVMLWRGPSTQISAAAVAAARSAAAQARQPPDWEVFFSGSQQMDFLRQLVHLAGACPCGAKAAGETFHAAPAIHALLHAVCFENQNTPIWGIKILPF
jgi:hypothetical protein